MTIRQNFCEDLQPTNFDLYDYIHVYPFPNLSSPLASFSFFLLRKGECKAAQYHEYVTSSILLFEFIEEQKFQREKYSQRDVWGATGNGAGDQPLHDLCQPPLTSGSIIYGEKIQRRFESTRG